MTSENYRKFAVASLNSTEGAKHLTDKVGLLIMAEAWLEFAEQTTQPLGHEVEEAHRMIERPLRRATAQRHQQAAALMIKRCWLLLPRRVEHLHERQLPLGPCREGAARYRLRARVFELGRHFSPRFVCLTPDSTPEFMNGPAL